MMDFNFDNIKNKLKTSKIEKKLKNFKTFRHFSQYSFIKITSVIGFVVSFSIFVYLLLHNDISKIISSIIALLFFTFIFIISLFYKNPEIISSFVLLFSGSMIFHEILSGGSNDYYLLFVFCFPIVVYFIHGIKNGLIWNSVFLILYFAVYVLIQNDYITNSSYSKNYIFVSFIVLVVINILAFLNAYRHQDIEREMGKQIYFDGLTELPNRHKMLEDIEKSKNIILCIINVDDFKEINDIFGCSIGDEALLFLKDRLLNFIDKTTETLYKLNGDEFAIVANSTDDEAEKIKRLIYTLNSDLQINKFIQGEEDIILRVSAGISDMTKIDDENVLSTADIALKEAKKSSIGVIEYSQEKLKTKDNYHHNITSLNIISNAIQCDRLFPYYQPILDNVTDKIEKFECLVRISDSIGQIYIPMKFLNIAKKSRLYPKITRIMLKKSVDRFKNTNFEFSINLSIEDFFNPYTIQFITLMLEENSNICKNINFEIIESEGIENYTVFSNFIKLIKKFGCKISIDDFGSGYSNFDHFLNLNVDYLKIDGSLIKNLDKDKNARIAVENIVKLSRELGIKTIAEYVHSKKIFDIVKDINVDYSQGFYIGYPSPKINEELN
ncbi:MAG: bifunctional diguanylate cyclase/phosphodiesterase [Spirochaetes bacterium]|nr:bifunctional diguanylate cyclase/phosphodiesterase [Spirochaetota bacterium]